MKNTQKAPFIRQAFDHGSYTQIIEVGVAFFGALAWSKALSDFFREELRININVV